MNKCRLERTFVDRLVASQRLLDWGFLRTHGSQEVLPATEICPAPPNEIISKRVRDYGQMGEE